MNFDLFYIFSFLCFIIISGFVVAGFLYIAYRFVPRFRIWFDKRIEDLPDDWEEVD